MGGGDGRDKRYALGWMIRGRRKRVFQKGLLRSRQGEGAVALIFCRQEGGTFAGSWAQSKKPGDWQAKGKEHVRGQRSWAFNRLTERALSQSTEHYSWGKKPGFSFQIRINSEKKREPTTRGRGNCAQATRRNQNWGKKRTRFQLLLRNRVEGDRGGFYWGEMGGNHKRNKEQPGTEPIC